MLWSSDTWHKDDNNISDSDDLEKAQSPAREARRSLEEGTEARLTEIAAPQVTPEQETGDDLEDAESLARTETHETNAIAEVAAPEPITHSRHSHTKDTSEDDISTSRSYQKPESTRWTELIIVGWLIFFSILGTLARLGVEALATYPYAIVPSTVLWANMGGSFLMGFLLEDRQLFRYRDQAEAQDSNQDKNQDKANEHKKIVPLYIGLTTGFCGSLTSFSTFLTDAFLALSNELTPPSPISPYHTVSTNSLQLRSGGFSFIAVLAILIIHPAVSIAALKTGAHIAVGVERITPTLPLRFLQRWVDPAGLLLAVGCWVGAILITVWSVDLGWGRDVAMALIFAPLGALSRFYVSRFLNARVPSFPLGTFAINIFGTCIEAMCYDLYHSTRVVGALSSDSSVTCNVLEGVMQGYCGCATTVSTWVVELNSLRRRHAWLYGIVSVGVALGLNTTIIGSVLWTIGFDQRCIS